MSKLTRLKDIVDQHLQNITMTESQKEEVRRRIAAGERGKTGFHGYGWAYSAGALALAVLLLVFLVLPTFSARSKDGNTDLAVSDSAGNTGGTDSNGVLSGPDSQPDGMTFDVLAAARTSGVVTPDTDFLIEVSGGTMTAAELESRITIEPAVDFTLQAESETRYTLTPNESFEDGEIVTVSIATGGNTSKSWAFQTDSSLRVESTLPGNNAEGMPVETGIELRFSRIVSSGMEEFFGITPAVSGSFLYSGKTVAFVPEQDLSPDTVYTVTIQPGLTAESGEVLESAYTFSFRTPSDGFGSSMNFYLSDDVTETFVPGDAIAVGVYAPEEVQTVGVTLYSIGSAEQYRTLAQECYDALHPVLGQSSDIQVSTAGLTKLDSFEAEITKLMNTYWYAPSYVILPDLEEGWYLAEISSSDDAGHTVTLQKLIQVSPISVYCQSLNGEAFFWLNDAETGESLPGADITLTLDGTPGHAQTGADGTALLSYSPADNSRARLEITAGGRTFVDFIKIDATAETDAAFDYFSYVYLDREVYKPSDTVRFWGILSPRNGNPLPSELQVMISSHGEPRKAGTVSVNSEGVFTGTCSFEDSISGYVTLSFVSGSDTLCSTSYTVMEYTKPTYVLTAEFDQAYYRAGDTMNVYVNAHFFDGTPASGLKVSLSKDEYGEVLTLDGSGKASATVPSSSYGDWTPTSQYVNVSIGDAEDVSVYAFGQAYFFPSDYMLTTEIADRDTLRVDIRSNAIDFDAFERHMENYHAYLDDLRGAPADVSGTISLIRCYYEKHPTGQYYDAIQKVTVDTYDYDYCEEIVRVEEFQTVNGSYTSMPFPDADYSDGASYRMDITYTSPDGVSFETSAFLGSGYYPGSFYNGYSILREDDNNGRLAIGETASFSIYGKPDHKGGATLYTTMTDRLLRYDVTEEETFAFTFTEEMLPNVVVYAAYFDGRHVYSVWPAYVSYDYTERQLYAEIETDRESYAPGDSVHGVIRLKDVEGKPVSANYAIGVVDEALFAILDQSVDPLSSLYEMYYYETPCRFTSYVDKLLSDMYAEGGGDGLAAEVRDDFADTAAFLTGKTNADGSAEFSFQLPDNLTSWRITAAAVSDTLCAGSTVHNITVTLPFFLNLVLNDSYTSGDDIALSARVSGVENGTDVTYTVLADGKTVLSANGKSGEYTHMNLGQFDAGSYGITVSAVSGSFSDAVTRTIRVEDSRHELTGITTGTLAEPIAVDAVKYPVTVLCYDAQRQLTVSALSQLLSAGGNRADQTLGRIAAMDILESLDPEAAAAMNRPEFSAYQSYNGGIRMLSYADPDALTTALALVSAAPQFDAGAAVNYLYQVLDDRSASSGEVVAAYLGLAAMREPVLADLRVLAASPDGFTADDQLLLASALALLGDDDGAMALYQTLVLPQLRTSDTWTYVDTGSYEENYAATAHAALLAALTGAPELDGMIRYLLENESSETSPAFALLTYVTHTALPASDAAFSCSYNGESRSWTLSDSPVVVLQFDREGLANADFRVLSGEVSYTAVYACGIDAVHENADGLIHVESSCQPDSLTTGHTVTFTTCVTFADNCPGETYTLDLVLPSGTRYSSFAYNYDAGYSLISQEGNRLTFLLDRRSKTEGDSTLRSSFLIEIHARTVLEGSFVCEEAIVTGVESSLIALGNRRILTIDE